MIVRQDSTVLEAIVVATATDKKNWKIKYEATSKDSKCPKSNSFVKRLSGDIRLFCSS